MSVDKLVDSTQLNTDLTSVANAIRTKGGTSASLTFPSDFVSAINAISSGGGSSESWRVKYDDTARIVADNPNYVSILNFEEAIEEGDTWRVTWKGTAYTWESVYNSQVGYYIGNPVVAGLDDDGSGATFLMYKRSATQLVFITTDSVGTLDIKIEKKIITSATLIEKTIVANGTYVATDDNVDGYSQVIVSVGGNHYSLINIVPEQSVAATITNSQGYIGYFSSYEALLEIGKTYAITFDSEVYICRAHHSDAYGIAAGDYRAFTSTISTNYLICPFCVIYYNQNDVEYGIGVRNSGTHTVKIDELILN